MLDKVDYTIVTAWYDVREKENHPLKDDTSNQFFCSMDWYFQSAELLFNKPFPMVIFTEPRFERYILSVRPPELIEQTRFIFREYEEMAYYTYFKKYEENHNKHKIHNVTQEKFTALYKFVVNQKVNFMKDVIMMNPFQTSKFAWMDMRLHCVYDMSFEETTQVMNNIDDKKVRLMQMTHTTPGDIYGRHDFYSWTRGKCAAGFFGGSREPLLKFCDLCQTEFIEALNAEMAPTDEMIYSYVIAHYPNLFQPYVGEYGDCLRNLLRTRGSHHLVFPFLQTAFDRGMHEYTATIADGLRRAYQSGDIQLSADNLHKTWYYNYVANFWMQNRDLCRELLNEYYMIGQSREDVRNHIRESIDFLRHMISYMGEPDLVEKFESI
jgi:Bacterial protein of unknown function (HtrL_YibB)